MDHHLLPLNVAGISEGKESFTHRLIRLMYGTRDHPDEFPQSIVDDTCTVTHAVTLAFSQLCIFMHTTTFYKYMCEPDS